MSHDLVDLALGVTGSMVGIVASVIGWLVKRHLGRRDALGLQVASAHKRIEETRKAVACLETNAGLDHFPYDDNLPAQH